MAACGGGVGVGGECERDGGLEAVGDADVLDDEVGDADREVDLRCLCGDGVVDLDVDEDRSFAASVQISLIPVFTVITVSNFCTMVSSR